MALTAAHRSCCLQASTTTRRTSTSIRQQHPQLQQRFRNSSKSPDQGSVRCKAVPVADTAADLPLVAEALGAVGIAAGGLFGALFNLEKQASAKLQLQVTEAQQQVSELQQQLAATQQELKQEQQARKEAEQWRPRLDAAEKELFKMEKGLEIKDGQLAVFMNTAHRQIKGLEETVKELQKMP